jgi:hypothetical protein
MIGQMSPSITSRRETIFAVVGLGSAYRYSCCTTASRFEVAVSIETFSATRATVSKLRHPRVSQQGCTRIAAQKSA